MTIFPAIDLKDGKAVRLVRGQMASAKIYSEHPEELAGQFADLGAEWLHVVDLDGAFAGAARNFAVIERIIARSGLKVQVGGGIRTLTTAADYVNAGAARVILGSVALTDPALVREAAAKFRVAVGIDALGGRVATQGWADVSDIAATELAAQFAQSGVEAIITTDIAQDGTLGGVNVAFTQSVARAARGVAVIASGGVATLDDIRAVRASGEIAGVIVGRAFYEGTLDLGAAFALARG